MSELLRSQQRVKQITTQQNRNQDQQDISKHDGNLYLNLHFSRSQALRYNTPTQKNRTVHTRKITSLIKDSLNRHPAYSPTLRKG